MRDKNENSYVGTLKANVVSKIFQANKGNQNKGNILDPKKNQRTFKKSQKSKGECFICDKCGHFAHDCRFKKKLTLEARVNSMEDNEEIFTVVNKINVVQGKVPRKWDCSCLL